MADSIVVCSTVADSKKSAAKNMPKKIDSPKARNSSARRQIMSNPHKSCRKITNATKLRALPAPAVSDTARIAI
jgi:hypothetical protein